MEDPTASYNAAQLSKMHRIKRNDLLAKTDWVTVRFLDQSGTVPEAWKAYRQALRDLPSQKGFPQTVNWPVAPDL